MEVGRMTRWIGCVATVLALAAGPTMVRAETLADALKSAYLNSGLLDQNRALLRAADEDVAQAVAGLRPIIDWTADIRRNFQRSPSQFGNTRGTSTTARISGSPARFSSMISGAAIF